MSEADALETRTGDSQVSLRDLGNQARELLQELEPLYAEIGRVWRQADVDARRAAADRRNKKVYARLRSTSLDELVKGQNVRGVDDIKQRGIRTAEDVLRSNLSLDQIPGVGAESVRKLQERARELLKPRLADLTIAASQDLWDGADEVLARALRFWQGIGELTSEAAFRLLGELVASLREIVRQTAWYRWLFYPPARRSGVRRGAAQVRRQAHDFMVSGQPQLLGTRLRDLLHHQGVEVERAYWKRHSADLISALEDLHRSSGDPGVQQVLSRSLAQTGGLDGDLAVRMRQLPFKQDLLRRRLRSYQEDGARFAVCTRGLLGDEMGLGKTTQALAAIAHCVVAEGKNHHAVVCPAALITTWEDEAKTVVPTVRTLTLGRPKERPERLASWQQDGGILLLSYDLAKELLAVLDQRIDFLVVDEAHYCKEPNAARTQHVTQLAAKADRCLLMTGTPLVNRTADMTNLMRIVDGRLAQRLEHRFGRTDDVLRDPDVFRHALSRHYLRRRQAEYLEELPELTRRDIRIQLPQIEVSRYKLAVREGHLPRMRIATSVGNGPKSKKMEALCEISEQARAAGSKMLVFSDYIEVLEIAAGCIGEGVYLIHGGLNLSGEAITAREREFQEADGFAALVYQIKMGGVGKNFQQASVVVLMEPQFTHTTEVQAISRAYRMGQTERVFVHRLVAQGTVDERLVELVEMKRILADELTDRSQLAERLMRSSPNLPTQEDMIQGERRKFSLPLTPVSPADLEDEDEEAL